MKEGPGRGHGNTNFPFYPPSFWLCSYIPSLPPDSLPTVSPCLSFLFGFLRSSCSVFAAIFARASSALPRSIVGAHFAPPPLLSDHYAQTFSSQFWPLCICIIFVFMFFPHSFFAEFQLPSLEFASFSRVLLCFHGFPKCAGSLHPFPESFPLKLGNSLAAVTFHRCSRLATPLFPASPVSLFICLLLALLSCPFQWSRFCFICLFVYSPKLGKSWRCRSKLAAVEESGIRLGISKISSRECIAMYKRLLFPWSCVSSLCSLSFTELSRFMFAPTHCNSTRGFDLCSRGADPAHAGRSRERILVSFRC